MPENPFLVPPPPREAPPSPAAPTAAPDDAIGPPPMITLPPGLVDSATLRIAAERVVMPTSTPAADRPKRQEVVFFPAPPGVAPQPAAPTRDGATGIRPSQPVPPAGHDATVIRPSRPVAQWRLALPDGRTIGMSGRLLLGRNPSPAPGWADAELLPLNDPAKSVSKTHAALESLDGTLFVHDLDSTNGVWITSRAGEQRVAPGERTAVPADASIELGEFVIRVLSTAD